MSNSRVVGRLVALSAFVALLATTPASVAMATDNGHGANSAHSGALASHNGPSGQTDAQQSAVKAARVAFLTSAQTVRVRFTTTLESTRTAIKAELVPFDAARDAARAAYASALKSSADAATVADLKGKYVAASAAFRTALKTAKVKYEIQVDAAVTTARSALIAATTIYTNAVKATFAPRTPPRGLLVVPNLDRGWLTTNGNYGWLLGHLDDSDDD